LTTRPLLSRLTTPRPPSLDLKLFRSAHTRQLQARRRYMEFANRTVRALFITEYILQERPQKRRKASEETILQKVSSTQVSSQPPSKGNCSITPPPTTTLVHSSPSPGPSKPSPLQITRHSPSSSESDSDGDLPSVEMLLARAFSIPLLMLDLDVALQLARQCLAIMPLSCTRNAPSRSFPEHTTIRIKETALF